MTTSPFYEIDPEHFERVKDDLQSISEDIPSLPQWVRDTAYDARFLIDKLGTGNFSVAED